MSWLRETKLEGLAQPLAITAIAFTLGYQLRPYISPPSSSHRHGHKRSISTSSSSQKKKHQGFEVVNGVPVDPAAASDASPTASGSKRRTSVSGGSGSDSGASDTESDAEDEAAAMTSDIASVRAGMMEEVKLVLVVNDSLKMAKGKIAAQAGHATLACALMLKDVNPKLYRSWRMRGQPKIALRCSDTAELDSLAAQARSLNLCARTIQDAGRTQVAPGSKTILGIGPGPAKLINQVTGKLRLL